MRYELAEPTVLSYDRYRESSYFPALDGLRAISILLVLILHTNPILWRFVNGGTGVHIFFTISGYLITTLALREEEKNGAVSLKAFYIRRMCRIFPLYYLVLLVYVVMIIGLNYHGHRPLLLLAMPFYLSYMNDFAPDLPDMPFAHSWSLGVEEKFYLLYPALAFALWRGRTVWRFVGTAVIILLPVTLDRLGLLPFHAARYGLPLYDSYNGILIGCVLAFALHQPRSYKWLSRLAIGLPALLTLVLFLTLQFIMVVRDFPMILYSITVALAMVPVLIGRTPWTRLLATRPMAFIGVRSYGIYLVHMICLALSLALVRHLPGVVLDADRFPVGTHRWPFSLLILALACGSSLVAATVLNIAIERPFIAYGRRLTRTVTGSEPVAPARMADVPPLLSNRKA